MTLSERAPFVRGDRVRVKNDTGPYPGAEGEVLSTDYGENVQVQFEFVEYREALYRPDELELAPAPERKEP